MHEKPGSNTRPRRRRWPYVLLALVLIFFGALWGGYEWATARAESVLKTRLAERSLYLSYSGRSWVPWRGLGLEDMALYQDEARTRPILSLSRLDVDLPWREMAENREFISRWKLDDATLVLHDARGKVTLEHVTVDAVVRPGEIEYTRLDMKSGPRLFALSGKLHLRTDKEPSEAPRDVVMDLDPMRAILDMLDFKEGAGSFLISGTVSFDMRETPMAWSAELTGEGENVEWQGVPLRKAVMKTMMSGVGLTGTSRFDFASGSAALELALRNWKDAPLEYAGKITDSGGRSNGCKGAFRGSTNTLELEELQGRTPLELVIQVEGHDLEVNQLKGHASFAQGAWKFSDVSAALLGGTLALRGTHDGTVLRDASVSLRNVQMAELSPWLGNPGSSFGRAQISLNYKGAFAVDPEHLTGSGSLQIDNAPMVHVPLLDETYALFGAMIPGLNRDAGVGEMRGQFTSRQGVLEFTSFQASGGSITVTGAGKVDLVENNVSARAQGRLSGVGRVITSPIGRLLEMEVSGPLDDIRVRPAGPGGLTGAAIGGTVDVATGTVKEATKVTGSVVKEGVKIPFRALNLFKRKK